MPFAEEFHEIYSEIYKPVCLKNGLDCWRVDKEVHDQDRSLETSSRESLMLTSSSLI